MLSAFCCFLSDLHKGWPSLLSVSVQPGLTMRAKGKLLEAFLGKLAKKVLKWALNSVISILEEFSHVQGSLHALCIVLSVRHRLSISHFPFPSGPSPGHLMVGTCC